MLPIVRVLAMVSFAATKLRVRPAASTVWYSFDRCPAPTKFHQLTCSHCPNRRASELVRNTSSRVTKCASSWGGTVEPLRLSIRYLRRPLTVSTCSGSGPIPKMKPSARPPPRRNFPPVALTRLSPTVPPRYGIRRIVFGTWW